MRMMQLFFALLVGSFLFSGAAVAGAWLERIDGRAEDVTIKRGGDWPEPRELMRLQPGDEVQIKDTGTAVRILLASGVLKTVSKAQSPYKLPGGEGSSFLANLMNEARNLLAANSNSTQAVAMITRGEPKQVKLHAVGADENFVLMGAELSLGWNGGAQPYALHLADRDSEEPVEAPAQIKGKQASMAIGALPAGTYLLTLKDSAARPSLTEANITLVEVADLPDEAQKLLQMKLDARVQARLLINLLYKRPEWRFYAHDLALRHGLDRERGIVLTHR